MKRSTIICGLFSVFALQGHASPTLDQMAWNEVWDRYESLANVNLQKGEFIQILKYPIPIAWGSDRDAGSWQLQKIAGVIPKERFALDPSLNDKRLHDIYRAIVSDVV